MKIVLRKCPCCGGDYGRINDGEGRKIARLRCKCEIKKEVIWTIVLFIIVTLLCWAMLGGPSDGKERPVSASGTTKIEQAYARIC